jgi:hypothetical protein
MFFVTHSDSFLEAGGFFNQSPDGTPYFQLTPVEFKLLSRLMRPLHATQLTVEESAAVERLLANGLVQAMESEEDAGPNLWEKYGWSRARRVVLEAGSERLQGVSKGTLNLPGDIRSPFSFRDLPKLLHRSSVRFFRPEPVEKAEFMNFVSQFERAVSDLKWLKTYVVVQGVNGFARGVYELAELTKETTPNSARKYRAAALLECVQNQWWCGGPGFCVFLAGDLQEIDFSKNGSRSYIDLYVRLGEVGQEVIHAAYCNGLSGWMTPAVRESKVCELLGMNPSREEPLYFFKFALRDTEFEERYGTDGLPMERVDYENLRPYDRKTQRVHKVDLRRRDLRVKNRLREG